MFTFINIETDRETEREVRRIAKNLGFTLDQIVDVYLRWVISMKDTLISQKREKLSDFIAASLEKARTTR